MNEAYRTLEQFLSAAERGVELEQYDSRQVVRMLNEMLEVLEVLVELADYATLMPAGFPAGDEVREARDAVDALRSTCYACAFPLPHREVLPQHYV